MPYSSLLFAIFIVFTLWLIHKILVKIANFIDRQHLHLMEQILHESEFKLYKQNYTPVRDIIGI